MAISIHIDNVSCESAESLTRLGEYLISEAAARTSRPDERSVSAAPRSPQSITAPVASTVPAAPVAEVPLPPVIQTPAVPPTTPTANVELDSRGMPWDSRIHAETKAKAKVKVSNGTWRYRRNCGDDVIALVEAELRATMAASAPVTIGVDPGAPGGDSTVTSTVTLDGGTFAGAQVPPVPPAPPAAAADPGIAGFPAFMEYVTPLMTAGKLTAAQIMEIVKAHGLPHIGALAQRTDLIPTVRAQVEALVGGAA